MLINGIGSARCMDYKEELNQSNINKDKIEVKENSIILNIVIGNNIKHKKYGVGIIKALNNTVLEVEFNQDVKKFDYPSSIINGFIQLI